jgi:hypothetical protein
LSPINRSQIASGIDSLSKESVEKLFRVIYLVAEHRNFLMEVRYRAENREVEFLPDVHGLPPEDPSPWSSLDALTLRRAFLQVDEIGRRRITIRKRTRFGFPSTEKIDPRRE